jgi:hypothetical protein
MFFLSMLLSFPAKIQLTFVADATERRSCLLQTLSQFAINATPIFPPFASRPSNNPRRINQTALGSQDLKSCFSHICTCTRPSIDPSLEPSLLPTTCIALDAKPNSAELSDHRCSAMRRWNRATKTERRHKLCTKGPCFHVAYYLCMVTQEPHRLLSNPGIPSEPSYSCVSRQTNPPDGTVARRI